jgi:hypothetical protein
MKGIKMNFIRARKMGHILGLIFLAVAGISVGCTTKAETTKPAEPAAPKKVAIAATQTPSARVTPDLYNERQLEDDLEYSSPSPRRPTSKVSRASYEKIKIGMTLEQVEKLIGEQGMLVSTMNVNGRKTQIYKWSSDNFSSYIDVTTEGGKVIEKKDKNLK